jgi:hypothetical protein
MSTAWAAYIRGTNYHDPEAISIDTVDFYDRVVIATGVSPESRDWLMGRVSVLPTFPMPSATNPLFQSTIARSSPMSKLDNSFSHGTPSRAPAGLTTRRSLSSAGEGARWMRHSTRRGGKLE